MAKKKHRGGKDLRNDSLLSQYKTLALRADKRLQTREKYSQRKGLHKITEAAGYQKAMREIKIFGGNKRFYTKAPTLPNGQLDEDVLRAKMNSIKEFLRADTSTLKPGIDTAGYSIERFQQTADTFNKRYGRYGEDLSWDDIAEFYSSKKGDMIAEAYGDSKTVAKALGRFKKISKNHPERTLEWMQQTIKNRKSFRFSRNDAVDAAMKRMVDLGITPDFIREK